MQYFHIRFHIAVTSLIRRLETRRKGPADTALQHQSERVCAWLRGQGEERDEREVEDGKGARPPQRARWQLSANQRVPSRTFEERDFWVVGSWGKGGSASLFLRHWSRRLHSAPGFEQWLLASRIQTSPVRLVCSSHRAGNWAVCLSQQPKKETITSTAAAEGPELGEDSRKVPPGGCRSKSTIASENDIRADGLAIYHCVTGFPSS
ncbi:hypothetical protein SKAU_G00173770 [Synaphobranchus kaupii]|uniref:Uncharacterized protein n=1 Tax=Synaphobranchus kaupii TaxID=118154 RepID=A0A9Q1FLG1_SYNKA|nr:hypothetical protein SKAU_G00173770 [Synaphobranchus kaupii]